jgi:hypothetical protein
MMLDPDGKERRRTSKSDDDLRDKYRRKPHSPSPSEIEECSHINRQAAREERQRREGMGTSTTTHNVNPW